jgi:glyceraldehyde 3-phosphate dehydrogenase
MVKAAINGFGRIGRTTLRVALSKYIDRIKILAINTSGSMEAEGWAQLFEYDSVYRKFRGQVSTEKGAGEETGVLVVNHQRIPLLAQRDPGKIPWEKYGVDVVIECTGVFLDKKSASGHLNGGAKKVVISASAKETETFVIGVNDDKYKGSLIVNNASCTTNCVAPVTKVVMEKFGLLKGFITTIHAYTDDQRLVDNSHDDLRRARAAAMNIVPTTTGAARAVAQTIPSLKGIFDGLALRVPVVCGSITDFTFVTSKRTTKEEVNKAFVEAAEGKYRGIIEVSEKPLVSSDIIGNSASAIVDLPLTQVIDGDLIKMVAWYDNEWGFCCRLIELAEKIGKEN